MQAFPIIKDLVTDVSKNWEIAKRYRHLPQKKLKRTVGN
jgi:hypothetical protein